MERTTTLRTLVCSTVVALTWMACPAPHAGASDADNALVHQVPKSFASTCVTADTVEHAAAAITCTPPKGSGVTRVTYVRFPKAKPALAYYDDHVGHTGRDTETDCADLTDSESPFHGKGARQGRVTCRVVEHRSTLTWVDGPVVATATGDDDTRVYTWWERLVGRTLTATQQQLLTQLPGGFSRESCRDNGDASLKCWPFEEEDVYVVYFTQYDDATALATAYDATLAEAGLGRDTPPPTTDGTSCSFETFWGPDQGGVVEQPLGRIACIPLSDSTALVWTNDGTSVLTRAEGFSPEVLYQHFQQYSGAAPAA